MTPTTDENTKTVTMRTETGIKTLKCHQIKLTSFDKYSYPLSRGMMVSYVYDNCTLPTTSELVPIEITLMIKSIVLVQLISFSNCPHKLVVCRQ